jgi:hypothetical protein
VLPEFRQRGDARTTFARTVQKVARLLDTYSPLSSVFVYDSEQGIRRLLPKRRPNLVAKALNKLDDQSALEGLLF